MDITGAQVFLELGDVDEPGDQLIVDRELANLYGVPPEIVDVYRRYYALYFSAVGGDDPAELWRRTSSWLSHEAVSVVGLCDSHGKEGLTGDNPSTR